MIRAFVDTSAWYAFADSRTSSHARIKSLLSSSKSGLVTSDDVFDETVTLLRSRHGFEPARRIGVALRQGLLARVEPVHHADREEAWALFCRRSDQRLSLTDCTSFMLMRRMGLEIAISLDEDFRSLGVRTLP